MKKIFLIFQVAFSVIQKTTGTGKRPDDNNHGHIPNTGCSSAAGAVSVAIEVKCPLKRQVLTQGNTSPTNEDAWATSQPPDQQGRHFLLHKQLQAGATVAATTRQLHARYLHLWWESYSGHILMALKCVPIYIEDRIGRNQSYSHANDTKYGNAGN